MYQSNANEIYKFVDREIQVNNLKEHWPNFSVNVSYDLIQINGSFTKTYFKHQYNFDIVYKLGLGEVKCWIRKPIITRNNFIHINADNSLCLYHFRDYPMNKCFFLGSEIIPWIYEWIHYYEEYLVNGNIWKGTEASHG